MLDKFSLQGGSADVEESAHLFDVNVALVKIIFQIFDALFEELSACSLRVFACKRIQKTVNLGFCGMRGAILAPTIRKLDKHLFEFFAVTWGQAFRGMVITAFKMNDYHFADRIFNLIRGVCRDKKQVALVGDKLLVTKIESSAPLETKGEGGKGTGWDIEISLIMIGFKNT